MDPFTIAAIGLGIKAVGTAVGLFGDTQANEANQHLLAAQKQAETMRYQQMQADAERRRRQAIRQGIIQQHQSVSNTTLQGAGESSGASGAQGQANQETGWNVAGVNVAEHFGKGIYQANLQALQAKSELADAQQTQQFGAGLSSLGGAVLGNMGAIQSLTTPSPFGIAKGPG